MAIVKITKENFEEIRNATAPVLIDFYADWCGPCRMLAPVMEEIANERADVIVGKVNVDEESELASIFGVQSIPLVVLIKEGRVVGESLGLRSKAQILSMLDA